MSEFVNTRDTIGDQATVDGLVSHTLTELKENEVSIIASNACYRNDGLMTAEFPGVVQIMPNAFASCTALEMVRLGGYGSSGTISISAGAFNNCTSLKHLIIDRPTKASLGNPSAFNSTPIGNGEGAVYVPTNLISTYKADDNWKNFIIADIARYPLTEFDSIGDSWSEIFANADYVTDYPVKSTKTLELTDGTKIKMDVAALNTDVKSDDSGTAKMTWICHGVPYTHSMNATNISSGGWAESEMRSWLISDILSKIPQEIKSHIVSVKKSYRSKSPNDETLWSDDLIWLPSYKEVGLTTATYIESDGVTYPTLFPSGTGTAAKNARIKYNTSDSASVWWLRSAYGTTSFSCVAGSGNADFNGTIGVYGVVFGFCTD